MVRKLECSRGVRERPENDWSDISIEEDPAATVRTRYNMLGETRVEDSVRNAGREGGEEGGWTVSWNIRGKRDCTTMICWTEQSGRGTATPRHEGEAEEEAKDIQAKRITKHIDPW